MRISLPAAAGRQERVSHRPVWGVPCLIVFLSLVAAQCGVAMPPLPSGVPSTQPVVSVAVLTPMTGELATFGEMVRNGIRLAFDEWNGQGGIDGRLIQWTLEDTRCDPAEARQAAERAIAEGAIFIVGGVCSEAAIPIARVADEQGVLFIAATATHPLVTVDETGATRLLAFRAAYAYPYQGQAAATFALQDLHASRAAVLVDSGDRLQQTTVDQFRAAYVAGGGQVMATLAYTSTDADLDAWLSELVDTGGTVLYAPVAYPVANRIGAQIQSQGLDVTLIGSQLWESADIDPLALDGAYFTSHYSPAIPDTAAIAWAERYQSAFAIEPDTLAILGYDAGNLLATAIQRSQSLAPRQVAQALETMRYQGAVGCWRFDEQHNPLKEAIVLQIKDGHTRFVKAVGVQWPEAFHDSVDGGIRSSP